MFSEVSSSLKRKDRSLETKEQIKNKRIKSPQYIQKKNEKKNEKRKTIRHQNKMKKKELETNTNRYQKEKHNKNRKKNEKKNQRKRKRGVKYRERHRNHMFEVRNSENHIENYEYLIKDYELSIREGSFHICDSCGGIFFAKSIFVHALDRFDPEIVNKLSKFNDNRIQLCKTCDRSIKRGSIPKLSLSNGLEFPPIPPELEGLSELEGRLISPRIPFMQIRELGVDKQNGIKGNVVNFPINIDNTVKLLPRNFDKTETI